MKKGQYLPNRILLFLIFTTISWTISAQMQPDRKVLFGGGLGLGFGSGSFTASVSPTALYPINAMFGVGAGLSFNYSDYRNSSFLAYGGSVLGLFSPIPQLQLSAELEELKVHRKWEAVDGTDFKDDYWNTALFIGAGYVARNVTIGVRYDVLYDSDSSIYGSAWMPFVRVFF